MRVRILASGSTGNALLVQTDELRTLVDAGLPITRLDRLLEESRVPPLGLDHVVVNAAGCGASLREAETLWPPGHPRRAEAAALAARSVDALVLLDELGGGTGRLVKRPRLA